MLKVGKKNFKCNSIFLLSSSLGKKKDLYKCHYIAKKPTPSSANPLNNHHIATNQGKPKHHIASKLTQQINHPSPSATIGTQPKR